MLLPSPGVIIITTFPHVPSALAAEQRFTLAPFKL